MTLTERDGVGRMPEVFGLMPEAELTILQEPFGPQVRAWAQCHRVPCRRQVSVQWPPAQPNTAPILMEL